MDNRPPVAPGLSPACAALKGGATLSTQLLDTTLAGEGAFLCDQRIMTPIRSSEGRVKRPLGVMLVALWQFCKAGFLVLVAAIALAYPNAQPNFSVRVRELIYIAAHGTVPPAILLPVIALPVVAIGWALLRLKKWARVVLLASSGWMLGLWIRYLGLLTCAGVGQEVIITAV